MGHDFFIIFILLCSVYLFSLLPITRPHWLVWFLSSALLGDLLTALPLHVI